jgi:8-oxo-dGTP pyrophosphatase MutT (NUDIX family)
MRFHYLARGVIRVGNRVLLAHQKGAGNTFLPGGHIGPGEAAQVALTREIEEELGVSATEARFVGAVEHGWVADDQENAEINLLFELTVPGLDADVPPISLEPHLEFLWARPDELERENLQPHPLRRYFAEPSDRQAYWGSSLLRTPEP